MVVKLHCDLAQQKLKQEQLYNNIPCFLPDTEDHEYALYDVMPITVERVSALRLATERITAIFFKVTALLQTVHPNVLCDMGYQIETINFVRMKTLPVPTVIARIDLIPSGNSFKCIEINANFIKSMLGSLKLQYRLIKVSKKYNTYSVALLLMVLLARSVAVRVLP